MATRTRGSVTAILAGARQATGLASELAWSNVIEQLLARPRLVRVIRAEDLLAIDFYLYNLGRASRGAPAFVRDNAAKPAYLVAQFQGQTLGEEAFLDPGAVPPVPQVLARARLAGPSRLAFRMPDDVTALPYSLEDFLDACRTWPMSLDALAAPLPQDFSDDLPIGNRFGVIFDANAVSKGGLAGLLQGAGLATFKADVMATLPAASGKTIARAADRAARIVIATAVRDLRAGRGDSAAIGGMVQRQAAALAGAMGLRKAEERQAVTAMVDVSVAVEMARSGFSPLMTTKDMTLIPGVIGLLFKPHKPDARSTWIETPYRLYQSPIEPAGWWHSLKAVNGQGRAELWHTRLSPKVAGTVDEKSDASPMMRAIWSPDYEKANNDPFRMSLQPRDRSDIVRATTGYDESALKPGTSSTLEPYVPKPTTVRRLMLSTLGSWLDSEGFWNRAPVNRSPKGEITEMSLEAWRHLSAMGRDYYVRVVRRGFLFPLGHRAAKLTVTERRFEDIPGGAGRAAYLRQFSFIVLREPVKTYPGDSQRFDARDFPLRRVEILTKVTPFLVDPGSTSDQRLADVVYGTNADKNKDALVDQIFWPVFDAGGAHQDVKFKIRAADMSERQVAFSMPLVFVETEVNAADVIAKIISSYDKEPARATADLAGQSVELAPQELDGDASGDTVFPVQTLTFAGAPPSSALPPNRPRFYPYARQLHVVVPTLKHIAKSGGETDVSYAPTYLANAFDAVQNQGQVFLNTLAGGVSLAFGGAGAKNDSVGGLVAPNMTVSALSRAAGAVGGNPNTFAGGSFDPADFFPSAKLFGTIDLKDLITAVAVDLLNSATPNLSTPRLMKVEFPDRVEIGFQLRRDDVASPLELLKTGAGGATVLDISAKTIVYLDTSDPGNAHAKDPEAIVDASLTNFKLNLFGCIIIWFDKLHFKAKAGEKPDVDPALHPDHPVVFGGPLEFVNALSEILPSNGFSDPPMLEVTPSGLTVGYSLGLPTLAVGIFSLQNMSIGAQLRLPFDGDPVSVRFNFCERQKPFLLTVSLFGGGGFFAISLDNSGVREVEAAFEFGAFAAIDLGVASGSVYVKAGIYYHWGQNIVELEGYFEMGGELSVLGIISVSLKFHLSLGYYKANGMSEVKGQASLVVEVEVLFFSTSVTVSCEKRLGGSPADPLFVAFFPDAGVWKTYADAFA